MKHRHHVHRHKHGMHHRNDGGSIPSHVAGGSAEYKHGGHVHHKKHRARGGGLVHDEEHGGVHDEEGGKTSHTDKVPDLVSGNKVVVRAAKETKSLGEVPGIYAKKRSDRKSRAGGYDAKSLVK